MKQPTKKELRKFFIYDSKNGLLINRIKRHTSAAGKEPSHICEVVGGYRYRRLIIST